MVASPSNSLSWAPSTLADGDSTLHGSLNPHDHVTPFDLRLPTPGCHNDPERAGLDAKSVFDGMTEHLFFTLGSLTASRHDLYMALSVRCVIG